MHKSVGAIIKRDGKYLLIDRLNKPFGFAGLAGHIDEGETPQQALAREVKEESNLKIIFSKLLFHEYVEWDECWEGVRGHHWYLYECETSGIPQIDLTEAKSMDMYTPEQIKELKLAPMFEYWFKKLGVI